MSRYFVDISEKAQADLSKLVKHEPKLYRKALKLIAELYELPFKAQNIPNR